MWGIGWLVMSGEKMGSFNCSLLQNMDLSTVVPMQFLLDEVLEVGVVPHIQDVKGHQVFWLV